MATLLPCLKIKQYDIGEKQILYQIILYGLYNGSTIKLAACFFLFTDRISSYNISPTNGTISRRVTIDNSGTKITLDHVYMYQRMTQMLAVTLQNLHNLLSWQNNRCRIARLAFPEQLLACHRESSGYRHQVFTRSALPMR
jgi:hypothetical protein